MPDFASLLEDDEPVRRNSRGTERLDPMEDAAAFDAVRSLLVGEERDDLKSLRSRLDRIEQDEADPEIRGRRVAQVLGYAFEQAALHDGDKIGNVLGPAIGEGIRHQLEHDRPAMVAALVPVMGSLVAGAVAEAMDKMSNGIDDRIDRLFSFRGAKLALRAKFGGGSLNDALVADLRRSQVERLYLFDRTTNALSFAWPDREEGAALTDQTADEILQSVLGLSGDVLNTGDHAVRSITAGDRHLLVRAGVTHTVVIEASGALSDSRRADLGAACFDILEFVSNLTDDIPDAEIDAEVMAPVAARILTPQAAPQAKKRRFSPAKAVAAVAAIAILGTLGWRAYDGHRIQTHATAVEQALRADIPGNALMLTVTPDRSAGNIAVLGTAFAATDTRALESRARELAAPYDLTFQLAVGNPDAASPRITALETRLTGLDAAVTGTGSTLAALESRTGQGVTALATLQDPVRLLSDFTAANAIFFETGSALRDPDRSAQSLDRLAALMVAVPDRPLRIVGYSDATGSRSTNEAVATARALSIAAELQARGIEESRLIAYGRAGPQWAINPRDGPDSPNRRVEFQLGFTGERP